MLSKIPEWWLRCSALLLLCCSSLNLVVVAQNDICTGLRRGYGDSGTTTFPIDMARVGTALSKVSPGSTFGTESNTQVTAMFSICTFLVSCPSVCANCSSMMIRTADAISYTSTNNTCSNVVYFGNAPEFISPPTAPLVSATLMLQYTSGSTTPDHTLYIGLMCDSSIPEHSAPTIDALGFFDVTTVVVQVHHSSFCPETKTVHLNLTHSWGVFTQTREKITATHKRERTASAALTASDPLTPSHALPHTKSVPITNSGALTPSFAGRLSRTASMMLTLTRDKNTKSAPVTLSVSTSSSRSATRTPPPMPTPSATHSMTRTRPSATQSVTRSNIVTGTRPLTMTKSLRVSTTASVTHSNTVTDSESLPHTKSPVPTVSHSVSLTASVTSSLTSTLSRTHIVTASKNTMSTSQALSATATHQRTPTRSINMSHSTSSSFDVTATTTLFPTPSPSVSLRITPSDSTTVTSSATISVSATLTVIPATNVSIHIGENATVYLGSAVPLPILQRVTLQINTEGSSVLQAVAGMALTFSLTTPASSGTSTINAFPPYSPRQINIVAVLSLTPELLPSYTPEAYGSILPVAMCVMLSQRSLANPFIMVMVTVLLNTTTGGIISGGTGINQLKMPQNVPTDNVPDSYGGYALYQLVFPSNAAPVVLLIRPTTLVFLAASMLSNPETPVFSAPSQVIVFNVAPYSVTAPLPYTTLTRLLTMQSTETYVIVYTRDGTDVCARAVGGISGSGVVNITTNMIPFQLIDNDTNKVHAQLVQGNCIRLGNAATGDYINSIVSDFDEGAAEDGWLGSAAHKTVLVPPAVKPLPSFVFRTSVSCTVAAIQLIKVTNGTSGVTLPTYTMLVGDLVAFTACSSTAPVVLSSRIFGSPVDNVDFPFALMVWGGALSLVNTSGGEILATILAPGNSTDQTLLLPFWMPPVDSPVPTPVLETGIQRLPFLMVRNNLLELVELQTVVQSGSKSNVTLILKEIITEDINRHIQAVALLPPFSYDVTNTSSFEGVALISVEPNMVITALLRPSKKALNRSGDDAPPLIHYRQQLVLPSIELDYVLSIKRWNRQATQTKGSSTLIYGNCSFITDLVPRRDGGDVFQTVQGEVFQLNTLRMSFLICVDHTYGIIEVISDMTASPSGVAGGVMRFTTPSYILSAHQQEFTVVSLGQSFYAALTKNGSTAGVSWHAYNPYLQFQSSSLVSPHRAKASNYTTPLPSNGLILSKYYQIELYALKVTGSVLVVRDIVNGGVNVWDYFLGMTCNQSSEFLVIDSAVDATVLDGGITAVSFVCLHDYIPSAFEPSIMISPITILLNASVYDGINRFTHRPTVVLVGSLQKFLGYVPPAYAFVNSGNYQYPEVNLIQFAVVACVASGPPSNVTTVCRIVLAIMGTEILLITPQLSTTQTPAGNWYTVVTGTVSTVYQAIGMQLSQRSSVAYVLSSEGITAFDTMSGAMLWVSNTVSVCRPAQEPLEFSPSNTPCHIEVMDELCDYGGACSVILVGYDNNGLPNILGFDSRGNVGSVPSGAIASVDPSWTFLPANISWSALGTVAFLAELLAPTQKWNSKVYLFSAANLSITCYSVRDTNSSLTELWTAAIVSNDVDSDSTVFSFLTEVLDNARGTGRNPCFGLLRVSDFGIVVALLRCSMPFQEESTGVWRVATYSVMVGLDALTGQLLWEVEPLTYDVLAVTTAGNTIIHQPRSFLADEDRGYVVWNATIMLAQISASPYFFNGSDNASDPWFHSQIEEERNIVGIDVLNGTLLFQIPIPRPSNVSSENEYGASANHFSHIPGTVPSPSALLLSLVPLSSILVITEYASRTTWATDVALFPLGHRITEVQEFYIEHLPSMDAFYLFGTLDIMLDSWRPTAALADWECTNLIPYSQLGLQDLGAGAVSLAVETEGCNASKRLTGILNWTALPRPFDNWWQAQQASRIANNAPLLGSVSTLSVPGQSIAGNFDFALLRHTGIVNLDVSSNELAGVLTSFDGLPTTVEFVNLSNQALYAGTQLPGAAASKLFTSIESLSYLQEATFLQSLDLSKNILSASISRDFLLYVPPSLRFLNLSDTNLFGQLFDFTRPVDNASSSHSFVAEPKTPREFNAVWKAILGRNASGSGLSVIDVSHNFFEDDPTTSRLMSAFCSDLYIPSITAMFLQNNRIASVAPPNFYNINTTNASDVTTFVNQCRLTYVDFSHNNISGALDFTSIAKTLLTLNLSHNDLRDVVDLTDLPTLWHANLSTLDVTFNPMLAGVLSPQCPPISPKLYYDPTQMPCTENNGGSSNSLYTEAICSDTRQSSMILPYLDPDSGHAVPGRLTMYYTQNQTADPSTEMYLTNCSFDTSSLLRFADGRIGYLDLFVYDTAACLPRNMLILDAYIDLAPTTPQSNAGAPTPNSSMVIANISIRFFRNATDAANITLASVATVLPDADTPIYWSNFTNGSCTYLGGSYCMLDTDSTPYRLEASASTGVALFQYGGYSQTILTTHVCYYNATVMVLPVALGGSALFPNRALLEPLVNCLPSTLGAYVAITTDGSNQIEIQDTTPVPAQFEAQICDHLPSPTNCPAMPHFTPPTSIAEAELAETCVDGFCADVKSIMWQPCGTSIWNYDGFHGVGECIPLSDILRLPMTTLKDPSPPACVYESDPPTCSQYAGRWTSFGVNLLLQAIQPDFYNNSLIQTYKENCDPEHPPLCANPKNNTIAPTLNETDDRVFCYLLELLSQPTSQIMVTGYCDNAGQSVFLTTCGDGPHIPILQLNSSTCLNGIVRKTRRTYGM
ncbi:Hypothetical protein, putative [Bodo saltans]|uniref:Membrane-associated protein n=1 Tax=Bodo saltans TaxID=75058 RepID=A0A0S4IXQ6_BODSA|nr:Hypothetical protein, putative [Bodo saltans]|eukprot:CUG45364.1 Hypothetical protein, putative [Bodo saltans]